MITPHPPVTSGVRKRDADHREGEVRASRFVAETGGQAGSAPIPVARRQDRGADQTAAGEGKIICLHNPDSVGGCPSMRKIRQFNHWARVRCIAAVFSTMGDRVFNHRFDRSEPRLRSDPSPVSDRGGSTTLETYYRLRVITPRE
jgi:hypothetical protein